MMLSIAVYGIIYRYRIESYHTALYQGTYRVVISASRYVSCRDVLDDAQRGVYSSAVFQVHIGVRGYVKDASNGSALANVNIVVEGIRHNLTTAKYGDYYRLLLPGTYNITAVAPG